MSIDNSQSGGIVAGWYADPADATRMRYWDGAAWTDRTAPLAAAGGAAPAEPAIPAAQPITMAPAAEAATTVMPAAAVSTPAESFQEFGGGFVTPAASTAAPVVAPAAPIAAPTTIAPAVIPPASPLAPAMAAAAPVVVSSGDPRPTDPALAKSARMVAGIFNIIALLVLVLGIVSAVLVVVGSFLVPDSLGQIGAAGIVGAILAALVILAYAFVIWAFWKLLSIVAAYIALRSE